MYKRIILKTSRLNLYTLIKSKQHETFVPGIKKTI